MRAVTVFLTLISVGCASPLILDRDVPRFCGPYDDVHQDGSLKLVGTRMEILQAGEAAEPPLREP